MRYTKEKIAVRAARIRRPPREMHKIRMMGLRPSEMNDSSSEHGSSSDYDGVVGLTQPGMGPFFQRPDSEERSVFPPQRCRRSLLTMKKGRSKVQGETSEPDAGEEKKADVTADSAAETPRVKRTRRVRAKDQGVGQVAEQSDAPQSAAESEQVSQQEAPPKQRRPKQRKTEQEHVEETQEPVKQQRKRQPKGGSARPPPTPDALEAQEEKPTRRKRQPQETAAAPKKTRAESTTRKRKQTPESAAENTEVATEDDNTPLITITDAFSVLDNEGNRDPDEIIRDLTDTEPCPPLAGAQEAVFYAEPKEGIPVYVMKLCTDEPPTATQVTEMLALVEGGMPDNPLSPQPIDRLINSRCPSFWEHDSVAVVITVMRFVSSLALLVTAISLKNMQQMSGNYFLINYGGYTFSPGNIINGLFLHAEYSSFFFAALRDKTLQHSVDANCLAQLVSMNTHELISSPAATSPEAAKVRFMATSRRQRLDFVPAARAALKPRLRSTPALELVILSACYSLVKRVGVPSLQLPLSGDKDVKSLTTQEAEEIIREVARIKRTRRRMLYRDVLQVLPELPKRVDDVVLISRMRRQQGNRDSTPADRVGELLLGLCASMSSPPPTFALSSLQTKEIMDRMRGIIGSTGRVACDQALRFRLSQRVFRVDTAQVKFYLNRDTE